MIKLILIYILFTLFTIYSQNFEIIFVTTHNYASNKDYTTTIIRDWGATGICLRILWGDVEKDPNIYNWNEIDNALNNILNNTNLDIYIRVSMGVKKPIWINPNNSIFTKNDFQINSNDELYNGNTNDPSRDTPLNFVSDNSKFYLERFYRNVLEHINKKYNNYLFRFKEFIPSVSIHEELEYPNDEMCGYSLPEKEYFINYLKNKYNNLDNLNIKWGSNFNSWAEILPNNYNWDSESNNEYIYPNGRVDWMQCRTKMLYDFIKELKNITKNVNSDFKIGLQLGCIYDTRIEKRGWYDPTILIQNVDAVRVAETNHYKPNFNFGADYLRTLCNFWTKVQNRDNIQFSTETNWPGYNNQNSDKLSQDWSEQLKAYYNKGANQHFIFGGDNQEWVYNLKNEYQLWRNTLKNYSNKEIIKINHSKSIHLGCEQILYTHNKNNEYYLDEYGDINNKYVKFELLKSIEAQKPYELNYNNYNEDADIITNKMIEIFPDFLNNYNNFYFTKSSYFITDSAYYNLLKSNIKTNFANATRYNDNGHEEFAFTHGIRNEYNDYRSPLHLIWRSRNDLIKLFPGANYPDSTRANETGWDNSKDYIYWARTYGTGYFDENLREYPEWNIIDNNNLYLYDENIRNVWNKRGDLQNIFCDSHHKCSTGYINFNNILDWVIRHGYKERPNELKNYNNWPYIGTPFTVKINGPDKLSEGESYNFLAIVKGGTENYNYQWLIKYDNNNNWHKLGKEKYQYILMDGVGFDLKVEVRDKKTNAYCENQKHIYYETVFGENNFNLSISSEKEKEHIKIYNAHNSTINIFYEINNTYYVELSLYNMIGQKILTIINSIQTSGTYNYNINLKKYQKLTSGIYFYILKLRSIENKNYHKIKTGKILLVK